MVTDVERIRTDALIIKGHYDIYAMVNRYNQGDSGMLGRDVAPKMTAVGANVLIAAVSGDTEAHLNGSQRPLHSAMELWDFFLRECQLASPAVSIIRWKGDVPERAEGPARRSSSSSTTSRAASPSNGPSPTCATSTGWGCGCWA